MAKKRIARVNEQMKRELITLLRQEVRDPRIGPVTITGVEVSPDLYHAKVFFSVLGDEEERKSSLEGLRAASGYLRGEIGRRMHIRRAPELHFTADNTIEHAMHIEKLLQQARATIVTEPDADDTEHDDA
ncbi:MAG: 30S ribosome-binding factor RbfA [Gemmatimonadota bacterium]